MIQTKRLNLRLLSANDAEFILELMNSKGWLDNIGDRKVYTVEAAKKYILEKQKSSPTSKNYLVLNNGSPIGTCGIYKREGLNHRDLGFAFLEKFHGQGFAFEAANAILYYHFNDENLDRVEAITLPSNKPSINLLNKLGFTYEKHIKIDNDTEELLLLSISLHDKFKP